MFCSRTGMISFFSSVAAASSLAMSLDWAAFSENSSTKIRLALQRLGRGEAPILARADLRVIPGLDSFGPQLAVQQLRPGLILAPVADENLARHKAAQPTYCDHMRQTGTPPATRGYDLLRE